jgi:hypothetical protein
MQNRCSKHLFEGAEDFCGKCGQEFCGECLVYAFGPKKPPLCIPCAVAAAGIRASAGNRPAVDKAEMKRMRKERSSAFRRFRRDKPRKQTPATPGPAPIDVPPLVPEVPRLGPPPVPPPVPASWPGLEPEIAGHRDPYEREPIEPEIALRPMEAYRSPSDEYDEEPFVTEPAYVDPSVSRAPISGL